MYHFFTKTLNIPKHRSLTFAMGCTGAARPNFMCGVVLFQKRYKWWLLNYQRRWSDKKWTFIKFHSIFYKKVSIFQIFLEKCHWNCAATLYVITEKCQKDNIFNFLKVKSDKIGFWRMGSDFLLHKMSVTFLKCDMKSLKKW